MKYTRGFSTIELILFLLIAGILLFLATPFLRSLSFNSKEETNKLVRDSPNFSNESNLSSLSKEIPDTNQSSDLPDSD
jgi:competence protein ComGC